jgi:hypothetical protein
VRPFGPRGHPQRSGDARSGHLPASSNGALRGTVTGVQADTSEGLLGLLHSGWQIVIAVCLLMITAIGLARLVGRGPTRMTNGVFITGFLIVAITVVGSFAVSCSPDDDRQANQTP